MILVLELLSVDMSRSTREDENVSWICFLPSLLIVHLRDSCLRSWSSFAYSFSVSLDTRFVPFDWHSYLVPFIIVVCVCLVMMGVFMVRCVHQKWECSSSARRVAYNAELCFVWSSPSSVYEYIPIFRSALYHCLTSLSVFDHLYFKILYLLRTHCCRWWHLHINEHSSS